MGFRRGFGSKQGKFPRHHLVKKDEINDFLSLFSEKALDVLLKVLHTV